MATAAGLSVPSGEGKQLSKEEMQAKMAELQRVRTGGSCGRWER
jgi:hypothetical protein